MSNTAVVVMAGALLGYYPGLAELSLKAVARILVVEVFLGFYRIERRLRAIQLRLATMHDVLDQLAGKEFQDHVAAAVDAA